MRIGTETLPKTGVELRLSPFLQQSLHLLAMPVERLEIHISDAVLENPCLEAADEEAAEPAEVNEDPSYLAADDGEFSARYGAVTFPGAGDLPDRPAGQVPLKEHLLAQLQVSGLTDQDKISLAILIEALDSDGYLRDEPAVLEQLLAVDRREVERLVKVLQGFDPPGVAARDLRESLLLQIGRQDRRAEPATDLARQVIHSHLSALAENGLATLARQMGVSPGQLQAAVDFIRGLNPRPGQGFGSGGPAPIKPDIHIIRVDGHLETWVDLPSTSLRINHLYVESLLREARGNDEVRRYLEKDLQRAVHLQRALELRRLTLLRLANLICTEQAEFLRGESEELRPLPIGGVAERLGLHESTVWRAVHQKYVQTPQGVFPMKAFFPTVGYSRQRGGVNRRDGSGSEVSSGSVQERIRRWVEEEDRRNPLSDKAITQRLNQEGIPISRRTVAKYRGRLGIAPAYRRRRY